MGGKNIQKGMALIVVLWLVATLGAVTMFFYRQATLSLKVNRNSNESTQARYLAEAAIYRVIAELALDNEETTCDHLQESWANNPDAFDDVLLGEGVYRVTHWSVSEESTIEYGAVDECSKLNINTISRDVLLRLPQATEEVVDPIIDWRDSDSDPGTFGAEGEYYQSFPDPYDAKNDVYDSIEELLLVKDMTLDLLYGEDTNMNGILDSNENDGEQSYPIDNSDNELDRGWYPYLTAYSYEKNVTGSGEKRININTASKESLQDNFGKELSQEEIDSIVSVRGQSQFASLGELINKSAGNTRIAIPRDKLRNVIDRMTITDEEKLHGKVNLNTASKEALMYLFGEENQVLIDKIMEYRQSENGYFSDLGQVLDIERITDDQFKLVCQFCCTKSAVFSIRAAGYLERSRAYKEIYAVVDRGVDPPEIRYWKALR